MNSTAINKKDNIDCTTLKNQKLATMPIRKLFFQMSIPTLLAQVVNLLYNIVDRVYVGRIQETNGLALAGLGVAFPIVLLVAAFAAFVGMGGAPRAAIAMGDNDNEKAQKLLGNSVTLIFIFSIGLSLIFYFIKDPVLLLFGASEASLPYASDYLGIYLLGTPFVMLALGLNPFITNQGFTKFSMITIVVGCALNIILDPIFIFVLNLGVKGAAIATVISQCVSAILTVWFFFTKKSTLKIKPKYLKLSSLIIGSILSLGVSTFIMQATECLIQLVFNAGMKTYGNDDYVAIMSILFSVIQIVFLPMMGFGQGAGPIMSFNYGAKNIKRVKDTFKLFFTVCTTFSVVFVGIVLLFPQFFISMFTDNSSLISLGIAPLRVFIFGMLFFGIQSSCQQTFVSLGEAKISVFLATLRKIILLIPLALIIPAVTNLGVWGLFIAEPISDIIAIITTFTVFKIKKKKLLYLPPSTNIKTSNI